MVITLIVVTILLRSRRPQFKKPLFAMIVTVVVITTFTLSSLAIVLNVNSPTGGPVRWASDFQIWACDNQLNLRDPHGPLGNYVGTPTLFEQNDSRIHFNGTPETLPDDASLGAFMRAVGGDISDNTLVVPLNSDNGFTGVPSSPEQIESYLATNQSGMYASFTSGNTCGTTKAEVQTFVYHFDTITNTYHQTKITHPESYELSHTDRIPPGDCVIMEFAPPEDQTNHLCASYGVLDQDRCTDYGVAADKVASCTIKEIR